MLRVLLILFAVVVLALIAVNVITTYAFRWEAGALAAFAASFLPFPDYAYPVKRPPS